MYSIFIYSQLIIFFQAIALVSPYLCAATIIDLDSLHSDIWLAIMQDEILQEYFCYPVEH